MIAAMPPVVMSASPDGPRQDGPGVAKEGAPGEPAVAGGLARAYSWMVAGPLSYLIPVLWVAAAVAVTIYLPSFASQQGSIADITPGDLPALRAEAQASRLFPLPALSRVAVVQRDPAGLSPAVQRATIASAVNLDRQTGTPLPGLKGALPIVNAPGLVPGAKEQSTTAITYLFFDPSVPWESQEAVAQRYAATLDRPGGSVVGVTGTIPGRLQQSAEIEGKLGLVEIATIILIVLIVGITFRSLGAPAVALLAGVVSYLVALPVIAWAGSRLGFDVPAEVEPLVVVLLLGIVTDYTIFYLSGMRQRLATGQGRGAAARGTTAQFTPIILTAGLMVAAGTAALMVASQQFFRGFGPGMALAVLVGLVVSVTLVPALLEVFGRLLFWPRVPAPAAAPAAAPSPARSEDRSVQGSPPQPGDQQAHRPARHRPLRRRARRRGRRPAPDKPRPRLHQRPAGRERSQAGRAGGRRRLRSGDPVTDRADPAEAGHRRSAGRPGAAREHDRALARHRWRHRTARATGRCVGRFSGPGAVEQWGRGALPDRPRVGSPEQRRDRDLRRAESRDVVDARRRGSVG